MPANYVLLAEQTVSVAVASVTFSNIPQTGYTDLVVKACPRNTGSGAGDSSFLIEFNGSSTGYTGRTLYFDGSSPSSFNETTPSVYGNVVSSWTANTFGNNEFYIPNYTSSNYKSFLANGVGENNATRADSYLGSLIWNNTAAITSIAIKSYAAFNFAVGSTFYLYGVAKLGVEPVIAPKATGGDIIVNDGTYWYHAFLASGTFTPTQSLSCDYLVVAGGGGGGTASNGGYSAGGGGAGGLRSTVTATGGGGSLESALSLTAQAYTVTIGAGGTGNTSIRSLGVSGSNTTFATITSIGGGGGAAESTTLGQPQSIGRSGGSGGGGGTVVVGTGGGAGTANQGYAGGGGSAGYYGGGGGGAGAVGANAADTSGPGALGGVGVQITALATPTKTGVNSGFYGGGGTGAGYSTSTASNGGGGTGGAGSGGTGCSPGIANTGGGGGANTTQPSGAGGSGIVIVRYTMA